AGMGSACDRCVRRIPATSPRIEVCDLDTARVARLTMKGHSGDLDGEIDLPTWERAEQAVARLAVRGRRDATRTGRSRSVYAIDIDWHGPSCATGQCQGGTEDRKSTRLNSSHVSKSY